MRQSDNVVGYEAFATWEVGLVKGKAKALSTHPCFTKADIPDIEQELLLETHLKRNASENWEQINASRKTILSRILDNRIRDLIESANTDKRRANNLTASLSTEAGFSDDGFPITVEDFLGEDHVIMERRQPVPIPQDLELDLSLRAGKLSPLQKRISGLLKQGFNVTETAKKLGMKRTTLNREIVRMRALFYEEGLQSYL